MCLSRVTRRLLSPRSAVLAMTTLRCAHSPMKLMSNECFTSADPLHRFVSGLLIYSQRYSLFRFNLCVRLIATWKMSFRCSVRRQRLATAAVPENGEQMIKHSTCDNIYDNLMEANLRNQQTRTRDSHYTKRATACVK